jgi:UDP-GlcNAc:undecaprenyl-phosphate GlcNAc-1-phosphate transferase
MLIPIFVASCLLSLLLNWWARGLAGRMGLVDRPDGHRKLQSQAIPLAGGIAIFIVTTAVIAALVIFHPGWRSTVLAHYAEALGLLLGSGLILLLGILDDSIGLRGRQKLLGQFVACSVIVAFGICIKRVNILGYSFELGILAGPLTIFWLLGAINALNLLDGIDGLVATIGAILSGAIALMAFITGHESIGLIACVLAGSLVGFLRFNLPPATMYLGDAGSMLIGLVVGVLAIQASLKGPGTILLASPMALWTIPIFDSAAAIIRRKLTGRSIYTTDRAHLHHHLVDRIGHRNTLACLAAASLFTSAAALLSTWWNHDLIAIVCGGAVVLMFVGLRVFGHSELLLVLVRIRAFGRSVVSPRKRKARDAWDDAVRLQGTRQWELLWETLTEWAVKLELVQVRLDVNVPRLGEGYHASWNRPHEHTPDRYWRLELPLIAEHRVMGYLKVVGERGGSAGQNLERLLDLLEQIEAHLVSIASADLGTSSRRPLIATPEAGASNPPLGAGLQVGASLQATVSQMSQ